MDNRDIPKSIEETHARFSIPALGQKFGLLIPRDTVRAEDEADGTFVPESEVQKRMQEVLGDQQ